VTKLPAAVDLAAKLEQIRIALTLVHIAAMHQISGAVFPSLTKRSRIALKIMTFSIPSTRSMSVTPNPDLSQMMST